MSWNGVRVLLWYGLKSAVQLFSYLYWRWAARQLRLASALLSRDDRATLGTDLLLASDREALGFVALNPGLANAVVECLEFLRTRLVVRRAWLEASSFEGGLPEMALNFETLSPTEEVLAAEEALYDEVMDHLWLTGGGLLPPRKLAGLFYIYPVFMGEGDGHRE